jgi:CRP-like cAMP-binding protein
MLKERLRSHDPRTDQLAELPMFSACSRRELEAIARLVDETVVPKGTVLTRQDAAGHECFVFVDGRAVVHVGDNEVARLGPGDIVGEMALLESEPRTATVVTTTRTRLLVMTRPTFTAVLDRSPHVARRVMRTLARRLRNVQSAA